MINTRRCVKCKTLLTLDRFSKNIKDEYKKTCDKCLNYLKVYNKDKRLEEKQIIDNAAIEKYEEIKLFFLELEFKIIERNNIKSITGKTIFTDLLDYNKRMESSVFYAKQFGYYSSFSNKDFKIILALSFDDITTTYIFVYNLNVFDDYINKVNNIGECEICYNTDVEDGYVCCRCDKSVCKNCFLSINRHFIKSCSYCKLDIRDYLSDRGCKIYTLLKE